MADDANRKFQDTLFLFQSDTTVGFASQNSEKLAHSKSREPSKPFLRVFHDFETLTTAAKRIPQKFKNRVRRADATTFIIKNDAFRVAQTEVRSVLIEKLRWYYSSSANQSGKSFERSYCEKIADIVIEDSQSLYEASPSKLLKINNSKMKKLR